MRKFRINTILVGFIFLTVFTCGEAPAEVFSPVSFSAVKVEFINSKRDPEVKSESEILPCENRKFFEEEESGVFTEVLNHFSFCSFVARSLPPRASPLFYSLS